MENLVISLLVYTGKISIIGNIALIIMVALCNRADHYIFAL